MSPAGIVAAALVSAAPQPAYPAEAVFAAFTDACADVGDIDKASASLPGKGWEAFEPAADSETGQLVARGKAMAEKGFPGTKLRPMATFRKTVAGEVLELVFSGVEQGKSWTNGCRVYDYNETRRITQDFMESKLGRKPDETVAQPGILEKAVWEPGYQPDHLSAELFYVPEGSPVISVIGSRGICMVAQATGEI